MKAAAVLMEILRSAGVRYLFGNPGTTELPFLDALPDSGLEYVLGVQEATAVAAADGYAQAAGTVGVVNVHVAPGLANGLSILHSAARAKTPLLVTAGQQDTRFLMDAPILAADLVRMAEQFTKWAYEIRRAEEAPQALRRALKVALTPPTGPVFLSLPMDLMRGVVEDAGEGPPPVATRTRPEPSAVESAARLLAGARAPLVIAGDGVGRAEIVARTRAAAEAEAARTPIGQAHLMHTLASLVPADVVVVDESATSLPFVLRYMPFTTPGSFFGAKTGTLGWGMGGAIGVQLALPERKVVATIGDGSVMYAPQALWTAAR